MAALPQMQEFSVLPDIQPVLLDMRHNAVGQDDIENCLAVIEKELPRTEDIISAANEFHTWAVNLRLDSDSVPVMSEEHVAFFLKKIGTLAGLKAGVDSLVDLWNETVDEKGNWQDKKILDHLHARRTKKITLRFRRLSELAGTLTSHQESDLVANLLVQVARQRELSSKEKVRLLHTIPYKGPITDQQISTRRTDMYSDSPSTHRSDWYK